MEPVKTIMVVEDEVLIADNISFYLEDLGYQVLGPYHDFHDAVKALSYATPDLVLLDVVLRGSKTGIDIGRMISNTSEIPFIYLTSATDRTTIFDARDTRPAGYITKPFTREDLFIGIEMAFGKSASVEKRKIEVRTGTTREWIDASEILFLEAGRSYVTLHLNNRSLVLRQSMKDFLQGLPEDKFLRVHRSFAVNLDKVTGADQIGILLGPHTVPVSDSYREEVFEKIRKR